jgi:hypothetical protein
MDKLGISLSPIFEGIYLATFESQPNFFKVGRSMNLGNRFKSTTYRTCLGINPSFVYWKILESRKIEYKLLERLRQHYLSSNCGKEVFHRNGINPEYCIDGLLKEILGKELIKGYYRKK